MKISYPLDWKAIDSESPDLVQRFEPGFGYKGTPYIGVFVYEPSPECNLIFAEAQERGSVSVASMERLLSADASLLSHQVTNLGGQICVRLEMREALREISNLRLTQRRLMYLAPRGNAHVAITLVMLGQTARYDAIERDFGAVKPVFELMAKSCVFLE